MEPNFVGRSEERSKSTKNFCCTIEPKGLDPQSQLDPGSLKKVEEGIKASSRVSPDRNGFKGQPKGHFKVRLEQICLLSPQKAVTAQMIGGNVKSVSFRQDG